MLLYSIHCYLSSPGAFQGHISLKNTMRLSQLIVIVIGIILYVTYYSFLDHASEAMVTTTIFLLRNNKVLKYESLK